ncbi:RNA polymerase sigma-70 factor [Gracilibacillus oryzae]|uniref:RNA polymerase sigma-70 factor n=1 Tax=Gracilibacillus oryzae TaxID=1672701 RepID=A0A7C8KUU7_9BACI|nr:RNA polymerase sigma-70 factor [Gracilibacillus oryzae]KAB8137746.1 RNA polymerase sigma-70 factor [Gracilibacillus oryzae]
MKDLYEEYKALLFTVAYRMLGSIKDAEDIVHDVFIQLESVNLTEIENLKSYLIKMVTNKSLNLLQSARKQREVYPGEWLPEPIVSLDANEPLDKLLKEESVSYAFVVLLQQLTDLERGIYLLREVLSYDYQNIAEMLDRSEESCRKVYSRAKQKLEKKKQFNKKNMGKANELAELFLHSIEIGNFDSFINQLTEDVVLITDGGGKARAAIYPIFSKQRVSAFLQGVYKRGTFEGELRIVNVNGEIGILQSNQGSPVKLIIFDHNDREIQNIYVVINPDKLKEIGHKFSF